MFMGTFGTVGVGGDGREVLRYTDLMIQSAKAENRGLVIQAVAGVLEAAREQWRVTEDPRYLELILRAADRLVKLGQLDTPEQNVTVVSVDPAALVAQVQRDLAALEARAQDAEAS